MIPMIEKIIDDLLAGKITREQAIDELERYFADAQELAMMRDDFAAAALQGMCANPNEKCWPPNPQGAYQIADAMIAEREKG